MSGEKPRTKLVAHIRDQIKAGTYVTQGKIARAAERVREEAAKAPLEELTWEGACGSVGYWEEIPREAYDGALDALPPAGYFMGGQGFLLGEPYAILPDLKTTVWWLYFGQGGKQWRCLSTAKLAPKLIRELLEGQS